MSVRILASVILLAVFTSFNVNAASHNAADNGIKYNFVEFRCVDVKGGDGIEFGSGLTGVVFTGSNAANFSVTGDVIVGTTRDLRARSRLRLGACRHGMCSVIRSSRSA